MDSEEKRRWLTSLKNQDPGERLLAAFMLSGEDLDADGIGRLREMLRDGDANVRDFAAQALGCQRDDASLSAIISLLHSTPPRWATGAAWAVSQFAKEAGLRDRLDAIEALDTYRKRARGKSRRHAEALLADIASAGDNELEHANDGRRIPDGETSGVSSGGEPGRNERIIE